MKGERILAIQTKRIGDLILTAPALERLKRERPRSEITLVTIGAAGQLVSRADVRDRRVVVDRLGVDRLDNRQVVGHRGRQRAQVGQPVLA